ncbi:phage portal protein [Sporosarcina sp. P37]|uniref:HK97 gp10 family phage protein n=1 Tax=unclassified Sporosarcina TaxID=2647733 RepID=UPI000A17C2CF|nr:MULTISPECIES: HK97 gp10 family phage protein [unclassified Sporosarcina]ARK23307.1 phage portal protein [Sporosarcina sp. P37]PID19559.1 phage portal protein [Sporosarcina sp. P35]
MKFEIEGLDAFMKALDKASNGGLRDEMALWLDMMGLEFLDVVQDEIIGTGTVDTGRLLNSFGKGDGDNVWRASNGGLTIEVGTNVDYAVYVNDGHMTNPDGVETRWVPGHWSGNRFVYEPGADTGMLLKQQWVPGTHYWDFAFAIFEKMFGKNLDQKLQAWIDANF